MPEDLSIIGLDVLLVSQYLDPPLTTVTFQKDLLGQKAMHLLHQILEEEACEKINLIKTTLVERSTVKRCRTFASKRCLPPSTFGNRKRAGYTILERISQVMRE